MNRIHDSLQQVFLRHRLVFWYDASGDWADEFDTFIQTGVTKLKVAGTEFGTKVRIVRDPDPEAKFLVYIPSQRPADADNWLLDLLLQGHEYKADRASLALQEVGLPHDFLYLAQEHVVFFNSAKRVQALKELIGKDDTARDLRLKMMAVLTGTAVEIDALLLHFLNAPEQSDMFDPADPADPVGQCFGTAALTSSFWRDVERIFSYTSATPSLRDFAVSLFRGANPLDKQVTLHPHAMVFLRRWKDSQAYSESYRRWSKKMEQDLQIEVALNAMEDRESLGDWDTFGLFENLIIHRLCNAFKNGARAADLRAILQQRRASFWYAQHEQGYAALDYAVELRELLAAAELSMESMAAGFNRYIGSWWRIDMAYRLCTKSLRDYGQVSVMEQISQWVEKAYVNNFLLPLTDRWSDHVSQLATWDCENVPAQRRFFDMYVQPFRSKGQKVFVIISDALRYEAAAQFAQRLKSANRWTAEIEAMLGSLPSYTQLGMAALLPGKEYAVDPVSANVTVDGRSAAGTENRAEILSLACAGKARAIQYEEFIEMNTKTNGRALMRDHDVIYIYHNKIDKAGHTAHTEATTFDAVEQAFDELDLIIKKIANINGTNMLLTADHGFLFQQDDVPDSDMMPLPTAEKLTFRDRRFVLGKAIAPAATVKVFESSALHLNGSWAAAFPLSLGRFPLQGSGKRYVHGSTSLQEIVIPVVKIHKARSDDIERIEVDFMRVPAKITTGQISLSLLQDRPAIDKVLPRTLRIGLYAKDNSLLSEQKVLVFDSKETEGRNRETTVLLVLSHAADAFNNRDVELRLESTAQGTNQYVTYKMQTLKLQKPFTSDFDD